jgi:uncharacterized membrane protein YgcG
LRPGLVALALLVAAAGAGAEAIRSFETEIHLGSGDAFTVVERIRYDFGAERRRGIFRDVPVRYGRGRSADYRIALEVEAVTDAAGAAQSFALSREGRNLRIRIGDPDVFRSGAHDYWIRYRVERGVLYFEGHDEIYWNATGTEWPVAIEAARTAVFLPEGTDSAQVRFACFTGPLGDIGADCAGRASRGVVSFESGRRLAPGEGLTVVVGLPKGVLREPSALARLLARLSDWLSAWLLVPLLALAGMTRLWRTQGRDPEGRDAIPVRYEPPEGLTPAEVGTVLDESADLADLTSSILDLAVRGVLRIEEVESPRFLFLTDRDWILRRLREPGDLRRHEAILLTRLFADGPEVRVSSLKNRFYQHLPRIREALYEQVSRADGLFPTAPDRVRRRWALSGGLLAALALAAIALTRQPLAPAGAFLSAGLIVLAFSRVMPRRTRRGRAVYEEILGFKEFLSRVDADRLERMGGRTAERFERILPYAVVLGAADAWADAFAGIYTEPPSWYASPRGARDFAPRPFVADVGRSLGTIGQTLSSAPRQSGSGSSGFGGGGASGGGFGGGGGGSW